MSAVVGRIASLSRFPVKSMAAEPLDAAELRWAGIRGDRQYAFLDRTDRSRFPWHTGREQNEMLLYRARYLDPADPKHSPVEVTAPDGARFEIADTGLRERFGPDIALIQLGRGVFDAMPVSIVTTATLAAIGDVRGYPVDPRRFRVNIVVESDVREDGWGGRMLSFGEGGDVPRLLVHEPIDRCLMITIDPETGVRSPGLMRTVVRGFGNKVGIYATPARLGTIRVGDAVRLA